MRLAIALLVLSLCIPCDAARLLRGTFSGTSMLPVLPNGFTATIEECPFSSIQKGDIILFRRSSRYQTNTLHVAFKQMKDGSWWTKGVHNPLPDDELVTPANFIGRLVPGTVKPQ